MIPVATYVRNLELAQRVRRVEGCVIECGVWRGGMIAGIAEILGPERQYFLFDSFQGLPPAAEVDGPAALAWQANTTGPNYHDNCTASRQEAEQAMRLSPASRYDIVAGWFENSLSGFLPPTKIALLRLDADWYESTATCLRFLAPHLQEAGMILIDDYYTWDGCAAAVHEFLAERAGEFRLRQWDDDVCVLIRQAQG